MLSNSASTAVASGSPRMKGSAPKSGNTTQMPQANRKLCWIVSERISALAQASVIAAPQSVVRIAQ